MKFKAETINLILEIKEYSNNKIKNNSEVSFIIDNSIHSEKTDLFNDIIFKAKFLKGVINILKNRTDDTEKYKLVDELTLNLNEIKNNILSLISEEANYMKQQFEDKFFCLTDVCLLNFYSLIEDLSICKDYFNDRKYKLRTFLNY